MNAVTPYIYSRIAGTGSMLPGAPVTNHDLVARGINTSDEWIIERTGIHARYLADPGVTASDLGVEAAKRALDAAGCDAKEIDLIIVATATPDYIFPSTACLIQGKLGVPSGCMAFDVQAVCSGFVYALTVADKFIRSGSHKKVLVIGAEVFSRILDWSDRATCVLFGDGAGAIVLEAASEPGILASVAHADGSLNHVLSTPGHIYSGNIVGHPFLRMDGPAVFKLAVKVLGDAAEEVMQQAGISPEQLDWLIPHQANIRILAATAKRLGMSMDKVIATVAEHGNTSAASVPLALDAAIKQGRVKRGQRLVVEGVGGGFTWGAVALIY